MTWIDLQTPDLKAARRFYGELLGWSFEESSGYLFARLGGRKVVWQGKAHRGAEVTGEPGAMAWHEVYTRDVAAACSFYGAVFGLESRRLEAPDVEYWTLHRGPAVAFVADPFGAAFCLINPIKLPGT